MTESNNLSPEKCILPTQISFQSRLNATSLSEDEMDQTTGKFSKEVDSLVNKVHLKDAEKQLQYHIPASQKEVELAIPILMIIGLMIMSTLLIGIL